MPREAILGNGRLAVSLDTASRVRDLHWPHLGVENHGIGHPSRIGLAVMPTGDAEPPAFAWFDDDRFTHHMTFDPRARIVEGAHQAPDLGVALETRTTILPDRDVLLRLFRVRALDGTPPRSARLFFHLDLHVNGQDYGDTVFYDPDTGGLVHYKRDRWFLHNGSVDARAGAAQHACGKKEGLQGFEGTWRDAEDGKLNGNPISYGACDSVLATDLPLRPEGALAAWWLAAGPDLQRVQDLDKGLRPNPKALLERAASHPTPPGALMPGPLNEEIQRLYETSVGMLLASCDEGGGIVAALDSDVQGFNGDTYSHVWPRDGALCAHALLLAGHPDSAERFHRYAARLFEDTPYLFQKYTTDGFVGSSWLPRYCDGHAELPIQEDETALTVWALTEHVRVTGNRALAEDLYETAVARPAEWMAEFRGEDGLPRPGWDLWERHRGTFTATAAAVAAALSGAARVARTLGHEDDADAWSEAASEIVDGLDELWLPEAQHFASHRTPAGDLKADPDASLVLLPLLNVLPAGSPRVRGTMAWVWDTLRIGAPSGGVARYPRDDYHRIAEAGPVERYPGNAWCVTTLWHADWSALIGRPQEAWADVQWVARHARPTGALPEQIHPVTGEPLNVAPLTWSHAAFVETICRLTRHPATRSTSPGGLERARMGSGRG